MVIDWVTIVNKVPDVALILVFVWFTLKMVDSSRQSSKAIMDEWKIYLANQNDKWRNYFQQRDETYISRIQYTTDSHSKDIESLSSDIREQTIIMKDMLEQMGKHDELLKFIANDIREKRSSAH